MAFRFGGHATVLVPGSPAVVVDPWRYRLGVRADVALVTHGHADHCSEDDLAGATTGLAPIVAPRALAGRLECVFGDRVVAMTEGEERTWGGATVRALPAEGPSRDGRACGFHPRGTGLAYLVHVRSARHLFLGDSAALPEHEGHAVDVAYFAVGGLVTMTPEEAAESASRVAARLSIPVHWGDLMARYASAERFIELCAALGLTAAVAPG